MIISHKYRFIYFAPVKTATTSLLKVFTHFFEAEVVGSGDGDNRHEIFLPRKYEDYFTFVSVRNPYERALSGFNHLNRTEDVDVMDCIALKTHLLPSMYDSIFRSSVPTNSIPVRLDAILHQETLQTDFDDLPFMDKQIRLPFLNVSPKKRIALGCLASQYIREFYQKDFEFFGYDLGHIPCDVKVML